MRQPLRPPARRTASRAPAVPSAVNRLIPTGVIERVPAPGRRRDHHRFREHARATLTGDRNTLLDSMGNAAAEGIRTTGHDSVAGRRLDETRDLYGFTQRETASLIDRWRQRYGSGDR